MDKLSRVVNEIAYARNFSKLSSIHLSVLPLLYFSSSVYKLALSTRHHLYRSGLLRTHRLPVSVISVGNLTWGGNGKTPLVEFLSRWFSSSGISPLILSRGYAGGDEVKMLRRHLGASARIGVGANRAETAARFLQSYGHVDLRTSNCFESLCPHPDIKALNHCDENKIGVAILDDGMQHLSLSRDVEIVMVNALMPWGNCRLLPLGPLREPLTALCRADIVVIHNADLIEEQDLNTLESMILETKQSIPIYFTRMSPLHFFVLKDIHTVMPLVAVKNRALLCVSAIGYPDAFVKSVKKLRPLYVDRMDFSDHHSFEAKDIAVIKERMMKIRESIGMLPVIVVTEKDYDRSRDVLLELDPYHVLVLCSHFEFVRHEKCSKESFLKLLKQCLDDHHGRFTSPLPT